MRATVLARAAALAATVALVVPSMGLAPAAAETEGTAFTVDDAQLRWGFNNESNGRAFAPGTFNFFSAGEIPNPGKGGVAIRPADWKASQGKVRIEKRRPDDGFARATWAGLSTTIDGAPLGGAGSGSHSGHQVVVDGGTGEVDPAKGTATITWKGTFTVLYYSGYSYFTVTDPRLVVTPNKAQLVATAGGYGSDMVDLTKWIALPDTQVVLADLPRADVGLPEEGGFAITPRYSGVGYNPPAGGTPQVGGPNKGSFPKSFVDFMGLVGSAAYWYSSGGAADRHKAALPLTVSYAAGDPVEVPDEADAELAPTPAPPSAPPPPAETPAPKAMPSQPAAPTQPAQPTRPAEPAATPVAAAAAPAYAPGLPAAPAVYALASSQTTTPLNSDHRWQWWVGSLLLLGAAALSMLTMFAKGKR